jgi:hypothetical protein
MNRVLVLLGSVILSGAVSAIEYGEWDTIKQVGVSADKKRVNIVLTNGVPDPKNCGSTVTAQADETQANIDQIAAIAMMAFAAGREVRLAISGSECAANPVKPKVSTILVR